MMYWSAATGSRMRAALRQQVAGRCSSGTSGRSLDEVDEISVC